MVIPKLENAFADWKERETLAEAMIPIIGKLYRKSVVTYCYGRALYSQSVPHLMKIFRRVRQAAGNELSEFEAYPVLEILSGLDLGPCHIDVGKLAVKSMNLPSGIDLKAFVMQEVKEVIGRHTPPVKEPRHVVVYGFGRIGRLIARLLIEKTGGGGQLLLKAVVLRPNNNDNLDKRASLLRKDSVHGDFEGTIRSDPANQCIIANGNVIRVIYADDRGRIDYSRYGIHDAIIIDSTGRWKDEKGLSRHLESKGADRVILTASARPPIKNIVSGVNSSQVSPNDKILAAASCTTNAVVPILKAVNDKFRLRFGHIETVHAYTADQNLVDNLHPKSRRGRAAPLNMVITETGASRAVTQLLPELEGRLTANAIRVPTPNVSLLMLHLALEESVTREELNDYLRYIALHSNLQRQVDFTMSPEVVSSDFVGNRHACVVDAESTLVDSNSNRVVIYAWYDNEFGYSCQVVRVVQKWAGIRYPLIPDDVAQTGF